MLGTALLAFLAAFISLGGNYIFGQCMPLAVVRTH